MFKGNRTGSLRFHVDQTQDTIDMSCSQETRLEVVKHTDQAQANWVKGTGLEVFLHIDQTQDIHSRPGHREQDWQSSLRVE